MLDAIPKNYKKMIQYVMQLLSLSTLVCVTLSACGKQTPPTTSSTASKDAFAITNLSVLNAAFFTGTQTPKHSVLAGGDGSIIYSSDNIHWQAANTPGIINNLTSLTVNSSGEELVATGENGFLAYSRNAGVDWQPVPLSIPQNIYASAYDAAHNTWVVAGADGLLFQSDSTLQDWKKITLDTAPLPTITTIQYLATLNTFLATGEQGLLLASTDGGKSWSIIASKNPSALNAQIHIGDIHLILTADGTVLRSEGAVNNWQPIEIDKNVNLIRIAFDSHHKTFNAIASNGNIFISDDDGKTWGISHGANQPLRNIIYSEKNQTLIALGTSGTLIFSDNGGRVWTPASANTQDDLESFFVANNGDVLALGAGGLLAISSDGGKTWKMLQDSITEFVHQIAAAPDNKTMTAVGANGFLAYSTNRGASWQKNKTALTANDYIFSIVSDMHFQTLTAVGAPGTIIQSTDNGESWQTKLALGDPAKGFFHKLLSNSQGTLVALSGPGTTFYSTDNGANWQTANINNEQHLFNGTYSLEHKKFVAVGNAGVIQVSPDGKEWKIIESGTNANLQSAYSVEKNLFVTGSGGIILRSTDGGDHWEKMQTNTNAAVQHLLHLPSTKIIIATGLNGLMLRSVDGGENWISITSPDVGNLRQPMYDTNTGIIYVPSRTGNILYSRDTGVTWSLLPQVTRHSIKGLYVDEQEGNLLGYGGRLIRVPLLK